VPICIAADTVTKRTIPLWRTTTTATELFGVRAKTDSEVVVEGRVDHRGCDWDHVAITVDRATGKVLGVVQLPTAFPDPASVPPPPAPPTPSEFAFEHGESAVVCSS